MCTAATYMTKDFYMGRNLDYEFSYGEEIVITPRGYRYSFTHDRQAQPRYAIIGMAHREGDYPLYYDAVNEKGVGMAGLNFVGNAKYTKPVRGKRNVAQYEIIPWVLSQCATLDEVQSLIADLNITDEPFSDKLPSAQLHWMIADRTGCITVEQTEDGLHIYENSAGVLTNNPGFEYQMFMLNNYMSLSPRQPENVFSDSIDLKTYSRGMGAIGLPGDLSSSSRFVKVAFTRANSVSGESEKESVSQFFHILASGEQQKGCCDVGEGKYEYTIYSSCWNSDRGIYYYKTYDRHCITAVDMNRENLSGEKIICYPMLTEEKFSIQND